MLIRTIGLFVLASLNLLFAHLHARTPNVKFEQITTKHGLAQSIVGTILQDNRGFMWFGTRGGLNRYDGYKFDLYEADPHDPHSLSSNSVYILYEDHLGILWVGTGNGLNKFDHKTDRFTVYMHDPDDQKSIGGNIVWSILEDQRGTLWVGTHDGGLNQLDRETNQFIRIVNDPHDPNSLSNNLVECIFEDHLGILWIGTADGLNKLEPANRDKVKFTCYRHRPDDPFSLSGNHVRSIHEDHTGVLWIGTRYNGLNKFDRKTGRFTRYQYSDKDPHSLGDGPVWTIHEDSQGILWIGTYGGGLNRFDRENNRFVRCKHDPADPHSLSGNLVESICEDNIGALWIGTWDNGVSRFDRKAVKFRLYQHDPNNSNSMSGWYATSICEDPNAPGRVFWIGTMQGGLNRFDKAENTWTHFRHDPKNPNSLGSDTIGPIYAEQNGVLWIGLLHNGLNKFNPKTGKFILYQHDANDLNSLSNNEVRAITQYPAGVLWIGTSNGLNKFEKEKETFTRYLHDPLNPRTLSRGFCLKVHPGKSGILWIGNRGGGLNRFDPETEIFTHYRHSPDNPQSISDNDVWAIHQDSDGFLWLGTSAGLNKFDPDTGTFIHWRKKDGLASDAIGGILEDHQGHLWLGARGGGLSRFDPKTGAFKNYDSEDGLQSNELPHNWVCKSSSGELFFGGIKGFNAFYPEEVTDSTFIPPVVLTDFKVFNKPVPIGAVNSPLQQHINESQHIILSHQQSVFSFEFAALNYRSPQKNRYAYIMENFEKEWNYVDYTRRFATYTNLPAGDYVFRVKASNNDGTWNEAGKAIKITITPPWWRTWWFRFSSIIIVIFFILTVYKTRTERIRKRSKHLEEINAELNVQINERKRAEQELLFKNTLLEIQKESSIDGILVVNDKRKVLSFNKRFVEMWNVPEKLLETRDSKKLLSYALSQLEKSGEFKEKTEYLYTHKKEKSSDEIIFKDGRIFDRYSAPLFSPTDEFFGRIWFFRDITQRKMLEKQLVHQEKLAVLGQLAGGVGHELRNPLGAIKNAAYFLRMALESPEPEVNETLEILEKEVTNSETIISMLLDFARARPPMEREVDINQIIQDLLSRINVPENIEVKNLFGQSIPSIMADPGQLDQAFGNIILNALQAMPGGGELIIKTEAPDPDWVVISFADTGTGIPREDLGKIFEPLFTGRAKGIGLGLAITRTFVEGHRGSIEVQSEMGTGSTFIVKLPVNKKEEPRNGREIQHS